MENKKFTVAEDVNIDVTVEETASNTKNNSVKDFILNIYDADILRFVLWFMVVALLAILVIFSAYSLQSKSGETTVVSRLTNDEGEFSFKGWDMTPDLEAAVEAGDISLKGITVIEKGGEIEFNGDDSDKITIIGYETVIEQNVSPKLYSDEYWEKLCREGKNTYVLRTIGLVTEKNEGAE